MMRWLSVATLLLVCGCVPIDVFQGDNTAMVPSSPFATSGQLATPAHSTKAPPSSPEAAITVDRVGQQLLAANKQLGIQPAFFTVGAPDPEIFHQGTGALFITESLVRQCKSENQLAAVLSMEIGKMISEREKLVNPELRDPPKQMPIALQMGNAGQFSGIDQLYETELATLDADRRRPIKKFVPLDPQVLARKYLEAAGFDSKELVATAPILQAAEKNYVLEKQFKGANNAPMWAPQ